jgi:hypothetical protein
VDLQDGLDAESTGEFDDLVACLSRELHLEPLAGLHDALDATTRDGRPAVLTTLSLANTLIFERGFSPLDFVDELLEFTDHEDALLERSTKLAVEWIYARPWSSLEGAPAPTDHASIEAGLVSPAMALLAPLVRLVLDEDLDPIDFMAETLRAPRTTSAWAMLGAGRDLEQGPIATLAQEGPAILGSALAEVDDASNDRSTSPWDDSLRAIAVAAMRDVDGDGRTVLEHLLEPTGRILGDPAVRAGLSTRLADAYRGRDLDLLLPELLFLMNEDSAGGRLAPTETSAFSALIELFYVGNREVSCSVAGYDFAISDNFSAWILKVLAEQDPDTVASALSLAGVALDWGLFLDLLGYLSESCSLDSATFRARLPALQRLVDPGMGDFTPLLIRLLGALHPDDRTDLTPELVEVLAILHEQTLVEPVEELTRDIGNTELARLAIEMLPVLLDPEGRQSWCKDGQPCDAESWEGYPEGSLPEGVRPLDFEDLCELVVEATTEARDGRTPLERLRPVASLLTVHDATWLVMDRLGLLLRTPGSRTLDLPYLLMDLQAWLDDDSVLSWIADLLEDSTIVKPALYVVEVPALQEALLATSEASPGPLPFSCNLVLDERIPELLRSLRLLLQFFKEASA